MYMDLRGGAIARHGGQVDGFKWATLETSSPKATRSSSGKAQEEKEKVFLLVVCWRASAENLVSIGQRLYPSTERVVIIETSHMYRMSATSLVP